MNQLFGAKPPAPNGGGLFGQPAPAGAPANPTAPAGPTPGLFGGGATINATAPPAATGLGVAPAAPAQIDSSTAALPSVGSKAAPAKPKALSSEKEAKMLIAASQQHLQGYLLAPDPKLPRSHEKEILDQLKTALGKYKPLKTDLASHNIEDRIDEILKKQPTPL